MSHRIDLETEAPFHVRCQPVLCALPSVYPDAEAAIAASPAIDKRNLQRTFQVRARDCNTSSEQALTDAAIHSGDQPLGVPDLPPPPVLCASTSRIARRPDAVCLWAVVPGCHGKV